MSTTKTAPSPALPRSGEQPFRPYCAVLIEVGQADDDILPETRVSVFDAETAAAIIDAAGDDAVFGPKVYDAGSVSALAESLGVGELGSGLRRLSIGANKLVSELHQVLEADSIGEALDEAQDFAGAAAELAGDAAATVAGLVGLGQSEGKGDEG